MSVARSRILDLMKTQCRIFNTVFNPQNLRLGNKILRQRLKGPALASYYPPRFRVIQEMRRAYPDWQVVDEEEMERVEKLERAKARGKGAPKKRRTKADSKWLTRRKPGQPKSAG